MLSSNIDEVKRSNYNVITCLGRGAFGVVYLCQDESGSEVTIKVINLDRYTGGLSSFLLWEIYVLMKLKYDSIVK